MAAPALFAGHGHPAREPRLLGGKQILRRLLVPASIGGNEMTDPAPLLPALGGGIVLQPEVLEAFRRAGVHYDTSIGVEAKERVFLDRSGGLARHLPMRQMLTCFTAPCAGISRPSIIIRAPSSPTSGRSAERVEAYVSLLWPALMTPIDAEWPNGVHVSGRSLHEFGRLCCIDRREALRRTSPTSWEYTTWESAKADDGPNPSPAHR
jgi:hypothetical protein